jgi:type III secretion system FlhB-like substrate exporter
VAGALLGASYGTAISLLVVWAMLVLQSFAPNAGLHVRGSMAARLATPLVSSFAHWAARRASNSDRVATAARQFVKDPLEASKDLTAVVNHRRVQSLLKDPKTVHALAHDERRVINSPALRALAKDKTFVDQATRLGLLDEGSDQSEQDVPRRIAQGLAPLARVIHTLAHDREVQSLLKDPQLAKKLQEKDMLSLANDEKFNRLAEILLERLGQSSTEKKAEVEEVNEQQ